MTRTLRRSWLRAVLALPLGFVSAVLLIGGPCGFLWSGLTGGSPAWFWLAIGTTGGLGAGGAALVSRSWGRWTGIVGLIVAGLVAIQLRLETAVRFEPAYPSMITVGIPSVLALVAAGCLLASRRAARPSRAGSAGPVRRAR